MKPLIPGPHTRPIKAKSLRMSPAHQYFLKVPGDFKVQPSLSGCFNNHLQGSLEQRTKTSGFESKDPTEFKIKKPVT